MAQINTYLYSQRNKGYMAYEYNPFHNLQVSHNIDENNIPDNAVLNTLNGQLLYKAKIIEGGNGIIQEIYYKDQKGNYIIKKNDNFYAEDGITPIEGIKEYDGDHIKYYAGSLIDLDTPKFNFDLNHPVNIEVQPSYDGSVNLILNDDKNLPRLINSRFSTREFNTYEIVDRIGENDTNIYEEDNFDKDTSLYYQFSTNPAISYLGFIKGTLPVGEYVFYFTYCDADDNESDFIAESGPIPVFIGTDCDPLSMDGGIKNQATDKGIKLRLNNLDKGYAYLKVYYIRIFADYGQNRVYSLRKLYKRFPVNSDRLVIQVTGNEETEELDPNLLNISRFNPNHLLAQA